MSNDLWSDEDEKSVRELAHGSPRGTLEDQLAKRVRRMEATASRTAGVQLATEFSAPPSPSILAAAITSAGFYRLRFQCVNDPLVQSYRIYRSTDLENPATGDLVGTIQQPTGPSGLVLTWEDKPDNISTAVYWICAVNAGGTESARVRCGPVTTPTGTDSPYSVAPGSITVTVIVTRDGLDLFQIIYGVVDTFDDPSTLLEAEVQIARDTAFTDILLGGDVVGRWPFSGVYLNRVLGTYYVRGRVRNSMGWSDWSATVAAVCDYSVTTTPDTDVPEAPENLTVSNDTTQSELPGNSLRVDFDAAMGPTANASTLFCFWVEINDSPIFPGDQLLFTSNSGESVAGSYALVDTNVTFLPAWIDRGLWIFRDTADMHHVISFSTIKSVDTHGCTVDSRISANGSGLKWAVVIPSWETVFRSISVDTSLLGARNPKPTNHFHSIVTGLKADTTYYVRVRGANIFGIGYWSNVVSCMVYGIKQQDLSDTLQNSVAAGSVFPSVTAGSFFNNTPSPGYVSWTGVTVVYNGVTYGPYSGNTSLRFIYWDPYQFTILTTDSLSDGALSPYAIIMGLNNNGGFSAHYNSVNTQASALVGKVTGDQIIGNTILASHMYVNDLSAISANLGTITGGMITGVIFRTSDSYPRIELTTGGLIQYDDPGHSRFSLTSNGLFEAMGMIAPDCYAGSSMIFGGGTYAMGVTLQSAFDGASIGCSLNGLVISLVTSDLYRAYITSDGIHTINCAIGLVMEGGDIISIGGNRVLGDRITGWSAASGTASRTTFDTATVTTEELAKRVKAIIDDLMTQGFIGT